MQEMPFGVQVPRFSANVGHSPRLFCHSPYGLLMYPVWVGAGRLTWQAYTALWWIASRMLFVLCVRDSILAYQFGPTHFQRWKRNCPMHENVRPLDILFRRYTAGLCSSVLVEIISVAIQHALPELYCMKVLYLTFCQQVTNMLSIPKLSVKQKKVGYTFSADTPLLALSLDV